MEFPSPSARFCTSLGRGCCYERPPRFASVARPEFLPSDKKATNQVAQTGETLRDMPKEPTRLCCRGVCRKPAIERRASRRHCPASRMMSSSVSRSAAGGNRALRLYEIRFARRTADQRGSICRKDDAGRGARLRTGDGMAYPASGLARRRLKQRCSPLYGLRQTRRSVRALLYFGDCQSHLRLIYGPSRGRPG